LRTDLRPETGLQDFVGTAPLNLIYLAYGERMQDVSADERRLYASVDAGFIGQNVYLFCASEGLATVFRAAVDYQSSTDCCAPSTIIPTKNDKSAISTHASMANAKDKPSIGSMLSFLVGRTRSAGVKE
jgi:hypothetical protein